MARPLKSGLDYFPLDVAFDDAVELIEAEHGLCGFAILIKLWQKIYANSYFLEWNADTALLFSKKINTEVETVNSVINACFHRNLFNKSMYERYGILTSAGIQKRYLTACLTAKRKNVSMQERHLLLDEAQKTLIPELIPLTPEETQVKSGKKHTKERKGKERKGKESNENPFITAQHLSMTEEEYNKLVDLYGKSDVDDKVEYAKNYRKLKNYNSLYLTLNNWLKKDKKDEKQPKEGYTAWGTRIVK